ncbi:MAG: isoprenyl transferase [Phycisphaerae bacterium]
MSVIPQSVIAKNREELGIPAERIPRSVAIIMDGNGRWAREKDLPRTEGHYEGAKVVRKVVTEAARLGLESLTLYSFSIENWRRPEDEVNALMHLYAEYLIEERPMLMDHNVRLRHLGRREGLPDRVLKELDESVRVSSTNTGMWLCLALNYGSRAEIVDAVRAIARKSAEGDLPPRDISSETIDDHLDSAGIPDPDLVIRTSGEMRLSNFLLWQISYSEFYVTETYWPDFGPEGLRDAIRDYAGRNRRFGGLNK